MADLEREKKALFGQSNTIRTLKTLPETVNTIINAAANELRQEVPDEVQSTNEKFSEPTLNNVTKCSIDLLRILSRMLNIELGLAEREEETPHLLAVLNFDPQNALEMLERSKNNEIAIAEFLA